MRYATAHARPDGDSTVARLAHTAAGQGFDGLVVRNHDDAPADVDTDRVADATGIDIVHGVEIRAGSRSAASERIGRHRPDRTVVCLHGGELNRFGVEQDRVDVLAHPMLDGDVNHVLAKAAARHGVRLEFDLSPVLRGEGATRVRAIRQLRKLRRLVRSYEVPFVVTAGARSHLQLRAPRELIAVGDAVGVGAETVREGLREWAALARRNRERRADGFVEPGVHTDRD